MIEVTPTTELPTWSTMLDGNTDLYEPQQLEYLDGNLTYTTQEDLNLTHIIIEEGIALKESFNFIDNGKAIVTTNDVDFTVSGNTISYKGTGIDLGKAIQEIDDLIVVKAKTPGFYVWTTKTDFGSFLVHQGVFQQNINNKYIDSDIIFCLNFPKERDYTLVSQYNPNFKVKGTLGNTKEKTTADRPLPYSIPKTKIYKDDIIQRLIANYPWTTDNFNTIEIKSKEEKLKCFILINNNFYWASLSFKEDLPTYSAIYSITNLSYTKAERVLGYGDKLLTVKSYNKLLSELI